MLQATKPLSLNSSVAKTLFFWALALPVLLLNTGCLHWNRPPVPPTLSYGGQAKYSVADFNAAYKKYQDLMGAADYAKAAIQRDLIINRVEVDIESNYREYEGKLSSTRATIETLTDATELGLSAATGVLGNADIKDLLAASLTGFKGTRLSFDKNFFREKTTEILISKMQASRDTVRNRITAKMALPVQQYGFEEAWRDLVEFFYSGTLQAALVQLANDAGADAASARKKTEEIDVKRAFTKVEADLSGRIRANFAQLYNQALKDPDASVREAALKRAKEALIELGLGDKIRDDAAPQDILKLLQQQIKDSLSHPEEIPKIDKALLPPTKEQ